MALIAVAVVLVGIVVMSVFDIGVPKSTEALHIGKATRPWPESVVCPSSVKPTCGKRRLYLLATVNISSAGNFSLTATRDDNVRILCRWPVGSTMKCAEYSRHVPAGESAIYGE